MDWRKSAAEIVKLKQLVRLHLHFLVILLLSGCNLPAQWETEGNWVVSTSVPVYTQASFPDVQVSPILDNAGDSPGTPSPLYDTSNTQELSFWFNPALPDEIRKAVLLPENSLITDNPNDAHLLVDLGKENHTGYWTYALVAAFPTLKDSLTEEEVKLMWTGDAFGHRLIVSEETAHILSAWWGTNHLDAENSPLIIDEEEILVKLWEDTSMIAILPFENITPEMKVLYIDGISPLQKPMPVDEYFLNLPILISSTSDSVAELNTEIRFQSNRDESKMTVLAMTGVTGLVRATAAKMNQEGVLYPADVIGDWLRSADLTHVSNEVSFAEDCPAPDPYQEALVFCSDPDHIALLEDIGTDIVELSGDHLLDWGPDAFLDTLEMYEERNWKIFAGGKDLVQAEEPLLIENNGNKLAFLGCNGKGESFFNAAEEKPGNLHCDYDWMTEQIEKYTQEGYLVIVTLQYKEYYEYTPPYDQEQVFRQMAEAGAVIVSGSQGHQPQAIALLNGSLIHFGLGNLFFDQYGISEATGRGFVDRHIFYNGRYMNTELLTYKFEDFAQPRLTSDEERDALLEESFSTGFWE